jgi:hypothetical protein
LLVVAVVLVITVAAVDLVVGFITNKEFLSLDLSRSQLAQVARRGLQTGMDRMAVNRLLAVQRLVVEMVELVTPEAQVVHQ